MEDFGWIIFLAVFWLLSVVGGQRKKQGAKRRRRDRRSEEQDVQVGPIAGRHSLARDLEESARRAEEALRRWEARQARQERREAAPARQAEAPHPRDAPGSRRTRRPAGVDERRREAHQAIADMLEGRAGEPSSEGRPDTAPAPLAAKAPSRRPVATLRVPRPHGAESGAGIEVGQYLIGTLP